MARKKYDSSKLNNIYSRIVLQIIFVLAVIVLLILIAKFNLMTVYYVNSARDELVHIADIIYDYDLDGTDYYTDLAEVEARYSCYVEIYGNNADLIYTSRINEAMYEGKSSEEASSEILKPRIMRILSHEDRSTGSYFEERQEYYGTARYLVYGCFLNNGCSVVLYDSLDVIETTSNLSERFIIVFCLILLAVMTSTILFYIISINVPLIKINRIAKNMARLNFSEVCPSYRVNELKGLSNNINHLSLTLKNALSDLRDKNARLEKDIQNERKLELVRREFISSASHELKTPIAIIQGYAEGLTVGVGATRVEEYSNIIMHEAEKMNSLVVRMLDLSKLESGLQLNVESFSIAELIDSYLCSYSTLFEDNGITLDFNIDKNYIGEGDRQYLCSVIGNYVSNAISHADFEKIIYIRCVPTEVSYRVSVINTGKNIGEDDIKKVWLSFYRVDKARSRDKGRFGLGLSIVRSIQDAHEQQCGVNNVDGGVEFWFDIKKGSAQNITETLN